MHEWNLVANANQFKEYGLTSSDIMNNVTPTSNLEFKNILNTQTGEYISGAHTGTSAGRYAHIELDKLLKSSNSYDEYVAKVRNWADLHIKGGADSLPGYLKKGEALPENIENQELRQKNC